MKPASLVIPSLVAGVIAMAATQASDYVLYVAMAAGWLAILAISFDVLVGYTGYISLAHGAFYGVGAYTFANLTTRGDWSFYAAVPASGVVACAIGVAVAGIAFRTRGLYFAITTLGIGLIGFQVFTIADGLTGGIQGFAGIPSPPVIFGLDPSLEHFLLTLLMVWIVYTAALIFTTSKIGMQCLAIREDLTLAKAMGIRVGLVRLLAFAFSAFFAGIGGAIFASASNFVGPESFGVLTTGFQLVVAAVVGGMGTLWGPALGAVVMTSLPEVLRGAATYSLLVYGCLLLFVMIFAPKGLAGALSALFQRIRSGRKGSSR